MLRIFAIALLLANALFFAWSQGMLANWGLAPAQQREPERLKAQIEPQALRLLNGPRAEKPPTVPSVQPVQTTAPAEVPVVVTEPPPEKSCWQVGGFSPDQTSDLRSALARTGLSQNQWELNEARGSGRWIVFMGRYNDEQMEKKKTELRELKIEFREVDLPTTGPGLALGTFSSEEAVQQALKDVTKKGVRSARAAVERPEQVSWTLRLPSVTAEQRASVEGLGEALGGKKLQACN